MKRSLVKQKEERSSRDRINNLEILCKTIDRSVQRMIKENHHPKKEKVPENDEVRLKS